MKVNVIAPTRWILGSVAKELESRLSYVTITAKHKFKKPSNEFDINYYINYQIFKEKSDKIDVALFTHLEESVPINVDWFFNHSKQVDYCVTMSKKYEDILRGTGITNVKTINLGIDLNFYKPKIIIGFVGKECRSRRKGSSLLKKINDIDFVDLRQTNGKLLREELPNFYRQLDYVIIASKIEGGPMCLIEGLACGIPIIAPKDVGKVAEFNKGIYHYENSNFKSLKNLLKRLYRKKLSLREQVLSMTHDKCAEDHDKLFRKLCRN